MQSEELWRLEALLGDPNLLRRPKEDLILVLDRLIDRHDQSGPETDNFYRLLAELITKITAGLPNQLALVLPVASSAPEAVLWLGLLQRSASPGEVSSAFSGVGWKLLSRLTDQMDPFKRPDCDISFDEAALFDLSRPSSIWENGRSGRIRVELAWGTLAGFVGVKISNLGTEDVEIIVKDNGIGLDKDRFNAFCTVDTEYKSERGGKGVGRLYWLDAFRSVNVESRYREGDEIKCRAIQFRLRDDEQIIDVSPTEKWLDGEIGTVVTFRGLRQGPYLEKFPKQSDALKNYLAAEFIADFLAGGGPQIRLQTSTKAGTKTDVTYPGEIRDLVVDGPTDLSDFRVEDAGIFKLEGYLCDAKASRGLSGKHQVHLLGNGRTVESRKVDDLLGIADLSYQGKDQLALHLIVRGAFLDERIAESRTAFVIPDSTIQSIVKEAVSVARTELIADQISRFDEIRRAAFDKFLANQPIFALGDPDDIFRALPMAATSDEAFVRHLAVPRLRAEKNREKVLQDLVGAVVSGDKVPEDFPEIVRKAAEGIHQNERSSLAHHAARRRVVLDLLDALIRRVRKDADREDREDRYHLEKTLHSLLAPMRVVSTNPKFDEQSAHDLWIIDERLAFASGFSSDRALRDIVAGTDDDDRPDIVIWDTGFGLGGVTRQGGSEAINDIEPLSKVFIVELKHPGRKTYKPEESIERQVTKYVRALKNGEIEGFGRRKIKVTNDCQFHCFVVADFEGRLAEEVESWEYIYNMRGRRRQLGGQFSSVVIEAVEWDYVLSTARITNRALLDAAGLNGHGLTDFVREAEREEDQIASAPISDSDLTELLGG